MTREEESKAAEKIIMMDDGPLNRFMESNAKKNPNAGKAPKKTEKVEKLSTKKK